MLRFSTSLDKLCVFPRQPEYGRLSEAVRRMVTHRSCEFWREMVSGNDSLSTSGKARFSVIALFFSDLFGNHIDWFHSLLVKIKLVFSIYHLFCFSFGEER